MNTDSNQRYGNRLFILCFLAYSFSYIGRMNYSACMPAMIDAGMIDKSFGGAVTTAYLICYGAGQFLNGMIGAKISPKFMIAAGLFGAGAMNICMGLANQRYLLLVIWALNGFFQSMLWSPVIRCFAEWLPDETRGRAGLNISLSIPCGTAAAYLIPSVVLRFLDYKYVFLICGGFVLSAAIVWISGITVLNKYILKMTKLFLQNKESAKNDNKTEPEYTKNIGLIKLLTAGGLITAVAGIVFNGALKDSVMSWVPTLLKETFEATPATASFITILLPLVSVFGAYVAVWINRKFTNNELLTSAVLFVISCLSMTSLALFGKYNMILSAALIGISVSSMWGVNTMFLTFIPFHFARIGKSSTVTGFLNSCSYAVSSLAGYLYGLSAAGFGWSTTITVWAAVGLCGAAVCVVGSKIWGSRRSVFE